MEIFERASKKKLRFSTSKGQLSTEDLWDLSLSSLDTIAKAVNKSLKDEGEESFIGKKTTSQTDNTLRLDILKHVINVKIKAAEMATARADRETKAARIKELMAQKSDKELEGKSMEELAALLQAYTGEEVDTEV